MITLHDFGGVLDGLWTLSFGLSQFQGHGSWLVCEVVQNAAQFSSFPRLSINRKLRNIKGRTSYDEVVENKSLHTSVGLVYGVRPRIIFLEV